MRWLKIMVTALSVTMIAGFITIVVLFVVKFGELTTPASLPLPQSVELPDDSDAIAFTQGRNWFAIVTDDDEILIFDRVDGELTQTIQIDD